jgi:hypothetical protein
VSNLPDKHSFTLSGNTVQVSFPRSESDTWLSAQEAREWARWLNAFAAALDLVKSETQAPDCPAPTRSDT